MTDFHGRVLVLGANGETGRRVIKALQAKGIPARALVRSEEKAQGLQSSTTEVVVGELLDGNDIRRAMQGITALISTLGTRTFTDAKAIEETEYTAIVHSIEAAKEAGVTHYVLCSSMGTDAPERMPPLADILRTKRRAEDILMGSGLAYTIVHPGGLSNEPGGKGVLVQRHPLPTNGMISRDDVAEVLVQALLQPEARNKSVDIVNQPEQGPANRSGLFN